MDISTSFGQLVEIDAFGGADLFTNSPCQNLEMSSTILETRPANQKS